jgi:UDP-glucuronate 4-epimerase
MVLKRKKQNILITGCSGFIGFSISNFILSKENINYEIVGIDNINDYYDINLKKNRLNILKKYKNFTFHKLDISNKKKINSIFLKYNINYVIHLAAQAGVRYSISNPKKYFDSNLLGFFNIIECAKEFKIKHFIYASTSSVYGDNNKLPSKEKFNTDKPLSFYAATKKCNEVIAYSYSNMFNLPTTGLRFFTVYGPYGRPDMSLFKFTKNILENKKVELFNNGNHVRDFTFIQDVCISIYKILHKIPNGKIKYRLINIGSNKPQQLKTFLALIENNLKKNAKIKKLSLQKGDIEKTNASNKQLKKLINYSPKTTIDQGVKSFIEWYKKYFKR